MERVQVLGSLTSLPLEQVSPHLLSQRGLDSGSGSEERSQGAWGQGLGDLAAFGVHSSAFV